MSNEFWLAVGGAIVGGGIAALLQWLSILHTTRQRDRGLAYSLLFKVRQIQTHLRGLAQHFSASLDAATVEELANPWSRLEGWSGSPPDIYFSAEEIALVAELGAKRTLSDLLSLDEKHNATFGGFKIYGQLRMEFVDALRVDDIDGHHGFAQAPVGLRPRMIALNRMVEATRGYVTADAGHALNVFQQLTDLFESRVRVTLPAPSALAGEAKQA